MFRDTELNKYILRVDSWRTPASDYHEAHYASAAIVKHKQRRGFYWMEGVGGYVFWVNVNPITITELQINGKCWMTDEPINWIGMQKLAEHSHGNVLCGGLGLGLIVHALSKNKKVVKIRVAEINEDVIKLISPMLSRNPNLEIELVDIYEYPGVDEFDTIILDMWVGKGSPKIAAEMMSAFIYFKAINPKADVFIWGHGSSTYNPSVGRAARKKVEAMRAY